MERFSVFGSRGRIGSQIVQNLSLDSKSEVIAVSRYEDFTKLGSLGHVIFAAGLTADFRQRPYDTMRAHVGLLTEILDRGNFESLVYLSSTRLYQNAPNTNTDATFQVDPANASDIYTTSKLAGEALCLQAGKRVHVARLSNVVGEEETGKDTFIGQIASEAISGHITLNTSLQSEKDYIWLSDAADCLIKISLKGKQSIYNVASGENLSHQKWINALVEETGCSYAVSENSPIVKHSKINNTDTRNDLGFEPQPVLQHIGKICKST